MRDRKPNSTNTARDGQPRDGKRTARAKSKSTALRTARRNKRALQGR